MHVTNNSAWYDHAGRTADALDEAEGNQRFYVLRQRAADAGNDEDADTQIKWQLAAPHVGQRTVKQLGQCKRNEERQKAQLGDVVIRPQIDANRRQCRKIHVDGKGTNGR